MESIDHQQSGKKTQSTGTGRYGKGTDVLWPESAKEIEEQKQVKGDD